MTIFRIWDKQSPAPYKDVEARTIQEAAEWYGVIPVDLECGEVQILKNGQQRMNFSFIDAFGKIHKCVIKDTFNYETGHYYSEYKRGRPGVLQRDWTING